MTEIPSFTIDPELIENDNLRVGENDAGDLVLTHRSTGATLTYDAEAGAWAASGGLDVDGPMSAEAASVDEGPSGILRVDATASDAQSRIEGAPADAEVWVHGGQYDPGSRTDVPQDVTVRFASNAWWEPTSDYDGFFVDHGSELIGQSTVPSTWSSNAVIVDSSIAGSAYRTNDGTHCKVDFEVLGPLDGTSGVGLRLNASSSGSITIGCEFDIRARGLNKGVYGTSESFLNGSVLNVDLLRNVTDIHLDGSGPVDMQTNGVIQPGDQSDKGIVNEATGPFPYNGQLWDVGLYDTYVLDGWIRVFTTSGITSPDSSQWVTNGPASVIAPQGGDRLQWLDGPSGDVYTLRHDAGLLMLEKNGTRFAWFDGENLSLTTDGAGLQLTSPDGSTSREVGIDNSGNVVSRSS